MPVSTFVCRLFQTDQNTYINASFLSYFQQMWIKMCPWIHIKIFILPKIGTLNFIEQRKMLISPDASRMERIMKCINGRMTERNQSIHPSLRQTDCCDFGSSLFSLICLRLQHKKLLYLFTYFYFLFSSSAVRIKCVGSYSNPARYVRLRENDDWSKTPWQGSCLNGHLNRGLSIPSPIF